MLTLFCQIIDREKVLSVFYRKTESFIPAHDSSFYSLSKKRMWEKVMRRS